MLLGIAVAVAVVYFRKRHELETLAAHQAMPEDGTKNLELMTSRHDEPEEPGAGSSPGKPVIPGTPPDEDLSIPPPPLPVFHINVSCGWDAQEVSSMSEREYALPCTLCQWECVLCCADMFLR